jgi:hypothetical protein
MCHNRQLCHNCHKCIDPLGLLAPLDAGAGQTRTSPLAFLLSLALLPGPLALRARPVPVFASGALAAPALLACFQQPSLSTAVPYGRSLPAYQPRPGLRTKCQLCHIRHKCHGRVGALASWRLDAGTGLPRPSPLASWRLAWQSGPPLAGQPPTAVAAPGPSAGPDQTRGRSVEMRSSSPIMAKFTSRELPP